MLLNELVKQETRQAWRNGKTRLSAIKKDIAEMDRRLLKTERMFLDGAIDAESFGRLQETIRKERALLIDQRMILEQNGINVKQQVASVSALLSTLGTYWLAAKPLDQFELGCSIIPSGFYVENDKIRTP